jgi:hypothetical protein
MTVEFHPVAEGEFLDAIAFYNRERRELGYEFEAEVNRTIQRILHSPDAWAPLSRRTRRCRTNRFPYGVVYQVRGDLLLIVGVMHLRRHQDSWRHRLARDDW